MTTTPALTALSHALAELSTLSHRDIGTPRFTDWQAFTLNALTNLLGADAPAVAEFQSLAFTAPPPIAVTEAEALWRAGKARAYALLTAVRFQSYVGPTDRSAIS